MKQTTSIFPVIFESLLYLACTAAAMSGMIDKWVKMHPESVNVLGISSIILLIIVILWSSRPISLYSKFRIVFCTSLVTVLAIHFSTQQAAPYINSISYPNSSFFPLYYALILTVAIIGNRLHLFIAMIICLCGEIANCFMRGYFLGIPDINDPQFMVIVTVLCTKMAPPYIYMLCAGIVPLLMLFLKNRQKSGLNSKQKMPPDRHIDVSRADSALRPQASFDSDGSYHSGKTSLIIMRQDVEKTYIQKSDMDNILSSVVYFMSRNFKAYSALGFIYDQATRIFELNSFNSKSLSIIKDIRIPTGKGVVGRIGIDRQIFITGDIASYNAEVMYYSGITSIKSIIAAPILSSNKELLGALVIDSQDSNTFRDEHKEIMRRFSYLAAALITNVRMRMYMEIMAETDGLTQLMNHKKFQTQLGNEIERSRRYKRPVSLLMIDIDHFKKFNDTYGHPIGDLVLKEIARCIKEAIRVNDHAARYGGEEFAVIIPETNEHGAFKTAERIREKISQAAIQSGDNRLHVTISVGCASYPDLALTQQKLIENADIALYYSKGSGRNKSSIFSIEMASIRK